MKFNIFFILIFIFSLFFTLPVTSIKKEHQISKRKYKKKHLNTTSLKYYPQKKKSTEPTPSLNHNTNKKEKSKKKSNTIERKFTMNQKKTFDSFKTKKKQEKEIKKVIDNTKEIILGNLYKLEKALPKEENKLFKDALSEQLKNEQKAANKAIKNTKSPTLRRKLINNSKKFFDNIQKMMKEAVKPTKEIDQTKKIKNKEKRIYNPGKKRSKKIQKGESYIKEITDNPDAIDKILQKPESIKRVFNPDAKISPDELYRIQKDPAVQKYLKNYRQVIEDVNQKFFDYAKKTDPKYVSGTIVIEDKNGAINKLFKGYVTAIQKIYKGPSADPDKPIIMAKKHETGYARHSSHFNKFHKYTQEKNQKSKKQIQYGIDLKNPIITSTEKEPNPEEIRSHMLFGKFDPERNLIFIKYEGHGLGGPKEAALHLKSFFIKKYQKKVDEKKEKAISNDQFIIKDRKEKVPKEILKEYEKLLVQTGKNEKEIEKMVKKAKARGISDILKSVEKEKYKDQEDFSIFYDFEKFQNKIKKAYNNDNLDIRVGNEVIIRSNDLKKFKKLEENKMEKTKFNELSPTFNPQKLRNLPPTFEKISGLA